MSKSWSVVIPSDRAESFVGAVRSVLETHEKLTLDRVVLVTGSIGKKDLPEDLGQVRIVEDERPFVFGRRVNMGFEETYPNDVVLMGDDVRVVEPGTFGLLKATAPLRIVAPAVEGRVGPPWQKKGQEWPIVPFISFTCLYIPRELYEIVGPIEEGFPGYGYEDTDYCIRVNRAGFSCGVSGVWVTHSVDAPSHFVEKYDDKIVGMEEEARNAFYRKLGYVERRDEE